MPGREAGETGSFCPFPNGGEAAVASLNAGMQCDSLGMERP